MAQIPDSIIEEILSRADIESVVGRYVTFTKRTGQNLFGLCPFHSEKTPSFSVSLNKGIYHCFGCGKGGNAIGFIMEAEKLSYPEAIRFLGQQYGVEVPEYGYEGRDDELKKRKNRIYDLLSEAGNFYRSCFIGADGKHGREYARKRQLTPEILDSFGIGYAPQGFDRLYNHLTIKGYTEEEMKESGLFTVSQKTGKLIDLFRGRLIFPIFDVFGKIIAFGGRALGDEMPKYINSPESLVYQKHDHLYGLNFAKKERDSRLIIVEGYMDVISMHQAGIRNAVAALGTSFTDSQLRLASRYAEEIIFFFDSDNAGQKAAIRAIKMMLGFLRKMSGLKIRIKIAKVPDGKDPDEYIKLNGKESFAAVVKGARDVDDYLFDRAYGDNCDETGKLDLYKFQEDVILYGSWIHDDLKREKLASNAANYLGAKYETLLARINDYEKKESDRSSVSEMRELERQEKEEVQRRSGENSIPVTGQIAPDVVYLQELKAFIFAVRLKGLLYTEVKEEDRIQVRDFFGKNMKAVAEYFISNSKPGSGIAEPLLINELSKTVFNGQQAEEVYLKACEKYRMPDSERGLVDEYLSSIYSLRLRKLDVTEKALISRMSSMRPEERGVIREKLEKISLFREELIRKGDML